MPMLRFTELEPKRAGRTKPLSLIVGIGALVGALALGTTFAANINLNGNNNVEFGQGVVTTAACDSTINVAPVSTFVNASPSASPAARFELGSIVFSGINTTDCDGKTFTIKAFGATGGALVLVNSTVDEILVSLSTGAFTEAINATGVTVANNQDGLGFTITLDSLYSPIAADQVYKITIESKDSVDAAPISYSVGDTGPGGGIVFYVSATNFTSAGSTCNTTCKYLEVAPATWQTGNIAEDSDYGWSSDTIIQTEQNSTTATTERGISSEGLEKFNWKIGQGFYNTSVMRVSSATSAAQAAVLAYAGSSTAGQWFIPSLNELNELCKYARGITTGNPNYKCNGSGTLKSGTANDREGFAATEYWSSSEWSSETESKNAWFQNFGTGYDNHYLKLSLYKVRPIRAF
jgi:hypothetical protein